jgi:protein-L-isoaspartate O-methyltransferase
MDEKGFYNKVAKKFGNYSTGINPLKEFPEGIDPESLFKQKLLEAAGKDKLALDVGCADGRFTLSIAPSYQKIIAIDISDGMLEAAKKNQSKAGIENVEFQNRDAYQTAFEPESFDVIYSRRGPTDYQSFSNLLKPRGIYVEIEIGEKDTQRIEEIFGRGQGYGAWNISKLKKNSKKITEAGLKVILAEDFLYQEYYATQDDLNRFLQGVPIFKDYNKKKDRANLDAYVAEMQDKKGIKLLRHRIIFVAIK